MFAWRLSHISSLSNFKIREKQQILAIATAELSPTEKVLLRISKLLVLIPFFIAFALIEGWMLVPALLIAGLLYPLLISPVEIGFAKPKLANAIAIFEKQKTTQAKT